MTAILLVPISHMFIMMGFSLVLTIVFIIQLLAGVWNIVKTWHCRKLSNHHSIFNLYLFHHLIICILRCVIIFLACFSIIVFHHCLSLEIFIHFVLLLSTFDLLLIIVGETAHFWDSTINHRSTLHSKCCLIFGVIFNYFISILFLAVHVTMNGDNPLMIEVCQVTTENYIFIQNHHLTSGEKSIIPTLITYILFILIDLLTLVWIYISYRDISNLKRKRLVTVFFSSLVFTRFKEHERLTMVNHSLKRLRMINFFLISNMIGVLPIITIKIFHISLHVYLRIFFVYLTTLPWMDCMTFFFYDEIRFHGMKFLSKKTIANENQLRRQRIGRRLSSYQDFVTAAETIDEK